MNGGCARNVRLYPVYQVFFSCYFWLPVFFLYFSERLPLGRVLQLEAVYYATVVLLEVPSGYFSDTLGRRRTLLIASSALVVSYALFFFGSGFGVFALAQACLAIGMSFNSGTDTALHFDSLAALGRADEYAAREAVAHRYALLGSALAALVGGLAAAAELRFAYGLSLVAAVVTLAVVLLLVEPPVHAAEPEFRRGFLRQVAACVAQLSNRSLAWLLGFAVLMIVINHVPYELYQPYVNLLLEKRAVTLPGRGTPLVTGLVTAVTMGLASWAAARSIRLRDSIGLAGALLATTALQVLIMAAMGLLLHEAVLLLILLRSIPSAVMQPPMRGAITPQLPRSLRATYLSLQSLAGRLAFAAALLLLSLVSRPGAAPDWPALSTMSLACAAFGTAGLILLATTSKYLRLKKEGL